MPVPFGNTCNRSALLEIQQAQSQTEVNPQLRLTFIDLRPDFGPLILWFPFLLRYCLLYRGDSRNLGFRLRLNTA
jgi:hypothetical protein